MYLYFFKELICYVDELFLLYSYLVVCLLYHIIIPVINFFILLMAKGRLEEIASSDMATFAYHYFFLFMCILRCNKMFLFLLIFFVCICDATTVPIYLKITKLNKVE